MKLDEALKQTETYEVIFDDDDNEIAQIPTDVLEAHIKAAKNWQTLVEARKDATAGEWFSVCDYLGDSTIVKPISINYSDDNRVCFMATTTKVSQQIEINRNADFITLAANLTEKDLAR